MDYRGRLIAREPGAIRLQDLPVELVTTITGFLPRSSRLCLGLTCHSFYYLVKDRRNRTFSTRQERFDFINTVSRDLPEYIPCNGWLKAKLYNWRRQDNDLYHCDHCLRSANNRVKYLRTKGTHPITTSGIPILQLCSDPCENTHHILHSQLTFGLRTLILRHELLGPQFGVPKTELIDHCSHSVGHKSGSGARLFNLSIHWQYKIVKTGNLIIQKKVTFTTDLREWFKYSPVCGHTQFQACNIARAAQYFTVKFPEIRDNGTNSRTKAGAIAKTGQRSNEWHRCRATFKCEYCATDAFLSICDLKQQNQNQYLCKLRFEVYHDLGNLYQPMTTTQRQVIDVATRNPTIEVKYPSTIEFHRRMSEDLRQLFLEAVPLNIRGTAIHAMEQMANKDSTDILKVPLPDHVFLFTHWGNDYIAARYDGSNTTMRSPNGNRLRSEGFCHMVRQCGDGNACACPAELWLREQDDMTCSAFAAA